MRVPLEGSLPDPGRFPTVPERRDSKRGREKVEDEHGEEGNACGRWFRRVCPCCCPRPSDDDINHVLVTGGDKTDGLDGSNGEKPGTAGSELHEFLLTVQSVDLMKSQSGENRTEHRTERFRSDDLIIRRGQTFPVWITLSRPFRQDTDKLHLELKTGKLPTVAKGTHVIIPLVEELADDRWEAAVVKQVDKKILLSVNSSPTAAIGRYRLTVETNTTGGSKHQPANDIFLLFNPWCQDDSVFMDSEKERQEYVLNDIGRIYYGTQNQIGVRTWSYGQFNDGILEACVYLLEKSATPASGWSDPVNVVRVISAMINASDDGGVLEGNWSGDYTGGTSPTTWSGSVEILTQYHAGGAPVRFGQCWVFAGVFTTVLRCLGIPSRTVTNFSSAHDTDVSLTTDVYLDESLDPIDELNRDSIWNFHVWNDCWMARPDLPPGNGGWQAVDSTPQETSQGTYRCGPASLAAIRHGQVFLKHDCPFVFAEVNSDKIYWQRKADGTFSRIYSEKNLVGHFISTKAVGTDERHDITALYKHTEGLEEERIAVETACSYGSKAKAFSSSLAQDVSLEVTVDGDGPRMGGDADLTVTLRNSSWEPRTLTLNSTAAIMYYTGVLKATVRKDVTEVELQPNEVKSLQWSLDYELYRDQLVDQAALMLTLSGRVKQTQQVLATQFSFRLRTPDLVIKPIGAAVVGEKMAVEISFTNPLPQVLKAVTFHVEGLGLLPARKIRYGDIGSRASVSLSEQLVPSLPGTRKLLASLDCRQLTQVHGVADITVLQK
ncbi:protein-glutamine gamma-glutamyltransferase K-like isoform 1-T4 [Spinachia spinachia]